MPSPTESLIHSIRTTLHSNKISDHDLRFPCSICRYKVKHNDKSILCTSCEHWSRIKCNGITIDEYVEYQNRNKANPELVDRDVWTCMSCILDHRSDFVPFINSSNIELINLNLIDSNKLLELIPSDEVNLDALSINQLSIDDLENNIEDINCKYYKCEEFFNTIKYS